MVKRGGSQQFSAAAVGVVLLIGFVVLMYLL